MEGLEKNDYKEDFKLSGSLILEKAEKMKENREKYQFFKEDKEDYESMHI
jgi:hypothetical protein